MFSVRSAYKLFKKIPNANNIHPNLQAFYKKLWSLSIVPKIETTIWRISWNYVPHLVNLRTKRIVSKVICPSCHGDDESVKHLFQLCPKSTEVWNALNMSWITTEIDLEFRDWITWVFQNDHLSIVVRSVVDSRRFGLDGTNSCMKESTTQDWRLRNEFSIL